MEYRLAEKKDIAPVCKIISSAIAEMERNNIYQWDEVYPAKEDFLSDMGFGQLYVGTKEGEVAVLYTINKDTDEQYANGTWKYPNSEFRVIHRLCVNPAFQNRGVAGETIKHIERELKASGVETIRLDVFTENPFALSLYRKNGYYEVGTADWRKGRFLLMEKHL